MSGVVYERISATDVLRRAWRLLPQRLRYAAVRFYGSVMHAGSECWSTWRLLSSPAGRRQVVRSSGTCVVLGLFQTSCGLGRAAWLNALALQKAGYTVQLFAWDSATDSLVHHGTLPGPYVQELQDLLLVHLHPPDSTRALAAWEKLKQPALMRVAFWVWETETAPSVWRLHALPFDQLWTPSAFSANALRRCRRPVRVMPHPCALALRPLASSAVSARAELGLDPEAFVVAFSFDFRSNFERKNPLGLIEAFRRAFPAVGLARLVIRASGHRYAPELSQRLERVIQADDTISLIDDTTAIDTLYAACDAYVSLHRAEGFGLTLAEAMLHGKPVIASGWSGNMAFMAPARAILIPCAMTAIRDPQQVYSQRQRWAEPDLDSAADALKALAGSVTLRHAVGSSGQASVREHLSRLPDVILSAGLKY